MSSHTGVELLALVKRAKGKQDGFATAIIFIYIAKKESNVSLGKREWLRGRVSTLQTSSRLVQDDHGASWDKT